tara:strand:+ start:2148 stop:2345 length:198 start_codon:yes stop_codon:yes gene_type:complete
MKTIDITPSRKGYASCLQAIIQGSTNAEDVAWAKKELTKLICSPDKPLSCGVKVWIETELEVETT